MAHVQSALDLSIQLNSICLTHPLGQAPFVRPFPTRADGQDGALNP